MNHRRPPVPVIVLFVLAVILGGYFILTQSTRVEAAAITASGSIEAVQVNIAPELAGRVNEVLVEEGQSVRSGDPLLRLDGSLLAAQRAVAAAQLDFATAGVQAAGNSLQIAQSQYQIALDAALAQGRSTRLEDWFADPNQFQQPGWYFTREEQIAALEGQAELTRGALEDAHRNLTELSESLEEAEFLEAERRLLDARLEYLIAQTVNNRAQNSATANVPVGRYNRTHCGTNQGYFVENVRLTNQLYKCTGDKHLGDAGRNLYYAARDELAAAQKAYDELLTTEAAEAVLQARAEVTVAQERYYATLDVLRGLQTGDQSTSVIAAQGVVDQAMAAVEQAEKMVQQAQANLDLLDAQAAKLVVYAPIDGVVLTRNVEPGEYVQPGANVLGLADLEEITITVYVPEDRYGQIRLGQQADVTVDSFPGVVFGAEVFQISDQAEFTPRNVQTVEGRSATVYAISLKVTDDEGRLKIGMPADVSFK